MFHVGNFHSNFCRDLNPGLSAPFAEILPLRQEKTRQSRKNIWLMIDIFIAFKIVESIHKEIKVKILITLNILPKT